MSAQFPSRPAPVDHPIHEVIANRWSSRAVDPDRPVDRATLLRLLEAARWAPSSGNAQPWRFIVFDGTVPDARTTARGCLNPGNAWALRAPVLLLVTTSTLWPGSDERNPTASHDTGLAVMALLLQGVSERLVVHPMSGFDHDTARRAFALPEDVLTPAMIAVGWPGDPALLDERTRARETRPRTRHPVSHISMIARWGAPGLLNGDCR